MSDGSESDPFIPKRTYWSFAQNENISLSSQILENISETSEKNSWIKLISSYA